MDIGISRTNNFSNTTFWAKSRTSGYSQLQLPGAKSEDTKLLYNSYYYVFKILERKTITAYVEHVLHIETPKSKSSRTNVSSSVGYGGILPAPNLKIYSFADMMAATKKFRSDMILGTGGFGTVFKGWVNQETLAPSNSACRMTVAIKKLNSESLQGFEQWQVLSSRHCSYFL